MHNCILFDDTNGEEGGGHVEDDNWNYIVYSSCIVQPTPRMLNSQAQDSPAASSSIPRMSFLDMKSCLQHGQVM
jgi:hypothetical protein